jgi:hypothetical protein
VRRSTSRCSAQSRTTSPAGRHNCGIGSSSQLATVIGAMNAGRVPDRSAYARWNQPELGAEAIGPLEVVPGALHRSIRPSPPLEVARWSCVRDAQEHHSVRAGHLPVVGHHGRPRKPFPVMKIDA